MVCGVRQSTMGDSVICALSTHIVLEAQGATFLRASADECAEQVHNVNWLVVLDPPRGKHVLEL